MSTTTEHRRKTLPPLDIDRVLTHMSTDNNPFANASLGELLTTFLESQNKIGLRQFAERAKMSRQRLTLLLGGAGATADEIDAIQTVFLEISQRMDMIKARMQKKLQHTLPQKP